MKSNNTTSAVSNESDFLALAGRGLNVSNPSLTIFVIILISIVLLATLISTIFCFVWCYCKKKKHYKNYQRMPSLYADQLPGFDEKQNEVSLGIIEYSLEYIKQEKQLKVGVLQASHLVVNGDSKQIDPYVKGTLIYKNSVESKSKINVNESTFQTTTQKHTVNPTFNEFFKFDIPFNQLHNIIIRFITCNYDPSSQNTIIGYIDVDLNEVGADKYVGEQYECSEKLQTLENDETSGELCVILKHIPDQSELHVTVIEAKNIQLSLQNNKITPDVFVSITTHVGKTRKLGNKKTHTRKHTVNPYFNETFVFSVKKEILPLLELTLNVKFRNSAKLSKSYGKVHLGSSAVENSCKYQWNEMLTNPLKPIATWHLLSISDDRSRLKSRLPFF